MTEHVTNYDSFRECLATLIIELSSPTPSKAPRRRRAGKNRPERGKQDSAGGNGSLEDQNSNDAEELSEFIEYLAEEIFQSLPDKVRMLSYSDVRNDEELAARYSAPIPQSTIEEIMALVPASTFDSLDAYGLVPSSEPSDVQKRFLEPLLVAYTTTVTAPPANLGPEFGSRASACEICDRDWIPLTYHHLIPRGVHAKVVKRGWHEEWRLQSVAWLCRSCHSMVHRAASNEELAREWYSVELLLTREDVREFAKWVSGVRWRKR